MGCGEPLLGEFGGKSGGNLVAGAFQVALEKGQESSFIVDEEDADRRHCEREPLPDTGQAFAGEVGDADGGAEAAAAEAGIAEVKGPPLGAGVEAEA